MAGEKLIAKQTGNQIPLELRKKYSEVQQIEVDGRRIVIYGIDKTARRKRHQIGYKNLVKAFGHDPSAKFKPQLAHGIWTSSGKERAITVVGQYGVDNDGHGLMKIQGSAEKVPRNEIKWLGAENNSSQELLDLKSQVEQLRREMQELGSKFQAVLNQKKELEAENQQLTERNTELERQLDEYKQKYELHQPVDIVAEPTSTPSDSRLQRSWNTASGWIGRRLSWIDQSTNRIGRLEEQNGKIVVTTKEEVIDGYTINERRRGAAAVLGAVAAIGAVVLIAGLWGEHEESEIKAPTPAVLTHPSIGPSHQELFKGGQAFKVELPGNLLWRENASGSYRIEDNLGHDIVPHVRWDRQGNLDQNSRVLLREDPYEQLELSQTVYDYHTPGTDFSTHYETIVTNK